MIEIKNLRKTFGSNVIFKNFHLSLTKGENLALIGFSGCGKSTLLKMIAGLESYDSGSIRIESKKLGMAFQYSALFDSLSIRDNIVFPLIVGEDLKSRPDENSLNQLAAKKLSLVGLSGIENQYPSELSGGMKKRISLARAIVNDPEILLYDEPTAGLDPVASTIIEDLILKIQQETKAAGIIVTHQASTIKRTADRVIMIYEGSIVWEGKPRELFDDSNQNPFAKQFREGNASGPMLVKT